VQAHAFVYQLPLNIRHCWFRVWRGLSCTCLRWSSPYTCVWSSPIRCSPAVCGFAFARKRRCSSRSNITRYDNCLAEYWCKFAGLAKMLDMLIKPKPDTPIAFMVQVVVKGWMTYMRNSWPRRSYAAVFQISLRRNNCVRNRQGGTIADKSH
jgi:hypothetical protein